MTTTTGPSGLIAILRGLPPERAVEIGTLLYEEGFRVLEVPLNSPEPLRSLTLLREALPQDVLVGAGTVLTVRQVRQVHSAGGQLVVAPNTDTGVITETLALGMRSYPGVATVTEAFTALAAGADALKLFPAPQVGLAGLRAWRGVLPPAAELVPVGGVGPQSLHDWIRAGATGFGIGSSLYRPDADPTEVRRAARDLVAAWRDGEHLLRPLPGS